jgi:putative transposase
MSFQHISSKRTFFLKMIVDEINLQACRCETNTWTRGALNVQEDHVHLFLSAPPSVAPPQIAHTLKGTIARRVFQDSPEVKKQL